MNNYYRPPTGMCWGCNLRKRVTIDKLIYNHTHATLHKACAGGGQPAVEGTVRYHDDDAVVDGSPAHLDIALALGPGVPLDVEYTDLTDTESKGYDDFEQEMQARADEILAEREADWTWWDRNGWTVMSGVIFAVGFLVGSGLTQWWLSR